MARANIMIAMALISHCSDQWDTAGTHHPTRKHTSNEISNNAPATISVIQPRGLKAGRNFSPPSTGTCGTTATAAHSPPKAQ